MAAQAAAQSGEGAPPRGRVWAAGLLIVIATFLAHGWCLTDGSVLDDYWHQRGLAEDGWSLSELIESTRIEPARWVHLWWQDQAMYWEYARPLFILTMKVVYSVLGGHNPASLHLFSLILHALAALLVMRLGWLMTRHLFWATVGGLIFVVYLHAVMTVQWPSALNAVQFTVLMLAAVLWYVRASGIELFAGAAPRPELQRPPLNVRAYCAAVGFWFLAVLTRENALLLPLFLLALDAGFGGRRHVARRWPYYLPVALLGLLFVAWRVVRFTQPMPEVYVRTPDGHGLEYAFWLIAKFLHYVFSSIAYAPMTVGPSGRFNPWIEAPIDTAVTLLFTLLAGWAYWRATRQLRGWWLWPLWIVLMLLPVTPVIATPHSGYAPGVGVALAFVLSAAFARRRSAAPVVALGYLGGLVLFTFLARAQWLAVRAAERLAVEAVVLDPPEPAVRELFLVNLPFANIYLKPALDRELGADFREVRAHVLNFAPEPLAPEQPVYVEAVGARSLRVTAADERFFSGLLGRFLNEAFRSAGPMPTGTVVRTREFEAEVLDADVRGVRVLQFTFARPLADPAYAFYVATPGGPGLTRLRFAPPAEPAELALTADYDGATPAEAYLRADDSSLVDRVATILTDFAAPEQRLLENPLNSASRAAIIAWWSAHLSEARIAEHLALRRALRDLRGARDTLIYSRATARRLFRTDLFLTGPPFPTSRADLARMRAAR